MLVDTAGRMQNNENLMKVLYIQCGCFYIRYNICVYLVIYHLGNIPQALAKLIHLNNPDLVLFVGEALVGNDGVDQLEKFNKVFNEMLI